VFIALSIESPLLTVTGMTRLYATTPLASIAMGCKAAEEALNASVAAACLMFPTTTFTGTALVG
jgi:hypothetical protein